MDSNALFIYTISSLHAGVGSTVSVVDLPIQRERTTQYPIVQGSGVKGALRPIENGDNKTEVERYFGGVRKDSQNRDISFAGAFSVGDARIVLFPVRSLVGVFAYVTCRAVLARVARDISSFPALPDAPSDESAWITGGSKVTVDNKAIVLEEFSFKAESDDALTKIAAWFANSAMPEAPAFQYWRDKVKDSLVVLPDDAFRDFVVNSTEVVTRVHLDDATKTVKNGMLWTQESLPADSLLMSSIIVRSTRDPNKSEDSATVLKWLKDEKNIPVEIQMGGDETTGQGLVALRWV